MSVVQNLNYGTRFRKTPPKAKQAQQIIQMLALENLLDRRPATLSGGEKQRVAIGRALLADPAIILADEPLAALDAQRKTEILPYFERLRDETDIPIIYVSHSVTEVARLATTVVALDNGKVLASGEPEDVLSNANVAPLGVRSVGSLLKAKVKAHHPDGLTELDAQGLKLFLPKLNNPIGSSVRVRIAAHDVMLSSSNPKDISALNILPGTINKIRAGDGPAAIVTLQTDAGLILARLTQRSIDRMNLKVGSRSYAIIKSVAVAPQDIGNGLSQNP